MDGVFDTRDACHLSSCQDAPPRYGRPVQSLARLPSSWFVPGKAVNENVTITPREVDICAEPLSMRTADVQLADGIDIRTKGLSRD